MIQALAALLGAVLTVAACYSAGALLIDGLIDGLGRGVDVKLRRSERLPLLFLLGAPCVNLAVFAILALRIAYWPVLAGLLLTIVAIAAWNGFTSSKGRKGKTARPNHKTTVLSIVWSLYAPVFLSCLGSGIEP